MLKKPPIRQCIGCREQKPKNELLRVVRTPEGTVLLDFRGKVSGRGAYLCRNTDCLKRAIKSRALERNLEVPIPEELRERLLSEMEAEHG